MDHYTGTCQGGPYNGTELDHYQKQYVVAIRSHPELHLMQSEPPDVLPEIKYGTYRYAMGFWIWREDAQYPRRDP